MGRRIGGAGGGSDPGPRKGAGIVVAGAALAIFAGGADAGLGVVAGGGTTGGAPSDAIADSVADSLTPRDLSLRTSRARRSARDGKPREAWGRMGIRQLRESAVQYAECVAVSTGRVRQFLLHTPCRSLHRMLLVVGSQRASVLISMVWVDFRSRGQAARFKQVEDVGGSGDITPLGGDVLGLHRIQFTGLHYKARPRGSTIVIAETEPLTGHPSALALDAVADVAAYLPQPT